MSAPADECWCAGFGTPPDGPFGGPTTGAAPRPGADDPAGRAPARSSRAASPGSSRRNRSRSGAPPLLPPPRLPPRPASTPPRPPPGTGNRWIVLSAEAAALGRAGTHAPPAPPTLPSRAGATSGVVSEGARSWVSAPTPGRRDPSSSTAPPCTTPSFAARLSEVVRASLRWSPPSALPLAAAPAPGRARTRPDPGPTTARCSARGASTPASAAISCRARVPTRRAVPSS